MNNKPDAEILERLAGIVGYDDWAVKNADEPEHMALCIYGHGVKPAFLWNPLKDDAQAFALVEKCEDIEMGRYGPQQKHLEGHWYCDINNYFVTDPDLKRAICLAVIEAHPGAHDE